MQYDPACLKCKHYLGSWKCEAFEDIPEDIMNGENDHKEPYKGDNGIQFEPADDSEN